MNERIAQALSKLFQRHRIVFCYDAKRKLREDFKGSFNALIYMCLKVNYPKFGAALKKIPGLAADGD